MISRFGVASATPMEAVEVGPAMLISHGCTIDKKNGRGQSVLEYLSFVPLQAVDSLTPDRQRNIRASEGKLQPYSAIYLGEVRDIGEAYAPLVQPYTVPSLLLQTELHEYSEDEAGDDAGTMVRPTVNDTRVGQLAPEALELFWRKWSSLWTGMDPVPDEDS